MGVAGGCFREFRPISELQGSEHSDLAYIAALRAAAATSGNLELFTDAKLEYALSNKYVGDCIAYEDPTVLREIRAPFQSSSFNEHPSGRHCRT
jgi:hypothetical protein